MQIRNMKWRTIAVWPPHWSIPDQDMGEEGILEEVRLRDDQTPGLIIVRANHLGDSRLGIIMLGDYGRLNFLFTILQNNIGRALTEIGNLEIDIPLSPPNYGIKRTTLKSVGTTFKRIINKN